ncbi:MAG: hypothetical protein AB1349_08710 [Elusimicrobiota bacterium]
MLKKTVAILIGLVVGLIVLCWFRVSVTVVIFYSFLCIFGEMIVVSFEQKIPLFLRFVIWSILTGAILGLVSQKYLCELCRQKAIILKEKGNLTTAEFFFRCAYCLYPFDEATVLNLGKMLLLKNQPEKTVKILEDFCINKTNESAEILALLTSAYFEAGELKKLVNTMKKREIKTTGLIKDTGFETPESFFCWTGLTGEYFLSNLKCEIDRKEAKSGRASLKIIFNFGYNVNFYPISTSIPALPSTKYKFSGWMKTDILSGDMGFEITDSRGYKTLWTCSELLSDKNDWKQLTIQFVTKPDTKELKLRIRHFGDDIVTEKSKEKPLKGTVWIDDWELKKL